MRNIVYYSIIIAAADIIRWYIENAGTDIVKAMGEKGRLYLEKNLTKDISVKKYIEAINEL